MIGKVEKERTDKAVTFFLWQVLPFIFLQAESLPAPYPACLPLPPKDLLCSVTSLINCVVIEEQETSLTAPTPSTLVIPELLFLEQGDEAGQPQKALFC